MEPHRGRTLLAAALCAGTLLIAAGSSRADGGNRPPITAMPVSPYPDPEPQEPPPKPEPSLPNGRPTGEAPPGLNAFAPPPPGDVNGFKVGPFVGILAVPRPLELGVLARFNAFLGAGVRANLMPSGLSHALIALAVANKGNTSAELDDFNSFEGELRLFPFGGAFSLSAGVGRQHLVVTLVQTTAAGPTRANIDLYSATLTPRLGWQWIASTGFTIGLDLGVQLRLSSHDHITLPAQATDTLKANIGNLTNFVAGLPLPILDLTAGFFF